MKRQGAIMTDTQIFFSLFFSSLFQRCHSIPTFVTIFVNRSARRKFFYIYVHTGKKQLWRIFGTLTAVQKLKPQPPSPQSWLNDVIIFYSSGFPTPAAYAAYTGRGYSSYPGFGLPSGIAGYPAGKSTLQFHPVYVSKQHIERVSRSYKAKDFYFNTKFWSELLQSCAWFASIWDFC